MRVTSEQFIEALKEAGVKPISYSGRCMFGRNCVGVVLGNEDIDIFQLGASVVAYLMKEAEANDKYLDPSDMPLDLRCDSMGLDTVYYWPSMEWIKETT